MGVTHALPAPSKTSLCVAIGLRCQNARLLCPLHQGLFNLLLCVVSGGRIFPVALLLKIKLRRLPRFIEYMDVSPLLRAFCDIWLLTSEQVLINSFFTLSCINCL